MTASALLTQAARLGIVLEARGDTLHVEAPRGTVTPELRAALAHHKPALLMVLWRLDGMRRHVGQVPVPCAVLAAVGGPGRCFSCGDSLDHPHACGRCAPCSVASELFYREVPDAADCWEVAHG